MRRDDRPTLGPGGVRGGPGGPGDRPPNNRRARTVLVLLLLASFVLITLDARRPDASPVEPLRSAASAVFGPLESAAATVLGPVTGVSGYFGDLERLRAENAQLRRQNDRLLSRLRTRPYVQNRGTEMARLLAAARRQHRRVVPAQVVAVGGAQTFSHTVTIDAGREDGVLPDMTVLNGDGLVGRVLTASASTASVLLVIDPDSVVGGRLGGSMELGFISGGGDIADAGRLRLELVDRLARTGPGDTVVTWGSRGGVPYVPGVPIGSVTRVLTSPRELAKTVLIDPYVNFSALERVGVVVDAGRGAHDKVGPTDGPRGGVRLSAGKAGNAGKPRKGGRR
jgi:rod shape-determining protein MreC